MDGTVLDVGDRVRWRPRAKKTEEESPEGSAWDLGQGHDDEGFPY